MKTVAIIGAGPAGLAAAEAALDEGARVVLLDSEDAVGGQYNRQLPARYRAQHPDRVQHGWREFSRRRDFVQAHPHARWIGNATVFMLERAVQSTPRIHFLVGATDGYGRRKHSLDVDALILCSGAHDRVVPFPGWTLPGVYTAGAAQTLAKSERVALGRRVIVSGSGPFLFPVASSLAATGAEVAEVLEANSLGRLASGWLSRPHELIGLSGKATELAEYASVHMRRRIPYRVGQAVVRALGDDRVEAVVVARLHPDWSIVPGSERTVDVDAVCVGHGFTPRLELAHAAGCTLTDAGAATVVRVDELGRTSVPGVLAAGEITGIGGADAAVAEGRLAGIVAASGEGRASRRVRKKVAAGRRFAERLAAAHPIGDRWDTWIEPSTVVCRCESTTMDSLSRTTEAISGAGSVRATKLAARAGLGPCQGRICGANVDHLRCAIARSFDTGAVPGLAAASSHNRPLAQPIRLAELASETVVDPESC